jgi:hypothetical protein
VNKRSGDSLPYFRKSAELRERIIAMRPNDAEMQRDLMMVYIHIADKLGNPLFNRLGDTKGACGSAWPSTRTAKSPSPCRCSTIRRNFRTSIGRRQKGRGTATFSLPHMDSRASG